jgi:hypothetical protein
MIHPKHPLFYHKMTITCRQPFLLLAAFGALKKNTEKKSFVQLE